MSNEINNTSPAPAQPDAAQQPTRAQLAKDLERLARNLDANYLARPDQEFPTKAVLSKLHSAITRLARASGIKRLEPPHFCGAIKRLDRRYAKLWLTDTIGKLVKKVVAVPQGPVTKITKHTEKFPTSGETAQLRILLGRIKNYDWNQDISDIKGKEVFEALERFVSPSFDKAFPRRERQSFGGTPEQTKLFYAALGMAAFADVHRGHLLWKANYEATVIPVVVWLYLLLNPVWDAELHKAFYGDAATVKEFKEGHKKWLARRRQQENRRRKKNAAVAK